MRYVDPRGLYPGEEYIDNASKKIREAIDYTAGVVGGTGDFIDAYIDQWWATDVVGRAHHGWANQDKYFHCRANCEAAQRGKGGVDVAKCISDAREKFDQGWPKYDKSLWGQKSLGSDLRFELLTLPFPLLPFGHGTQT